MEGKTLAGRYRLLTKLGEGGMGSVWRAEHLTLHSLVAIKLIDPSIAASQEAAARFQREAQAAAELRSTHIVQIFDYGIDDTTPFIVMELLEGESLADRLTRLRKLSVVETAGIFSQVARALGRAHQRGIVHRDLKPDNIFIAREDADEVIKLLDFGIAKKLDGLSTGADIKTHTGALLGTPYYMSPEQCLGQTDIDHHTDIWAMGVIAFECIVGKRPFERDTLGKLLMAICNQPIPRPSECGTVPHGFDEWFTHTVNRSRSDRFHSAAQAASELGRLCGVTTGAKADEAPIPSLSAAARGNQETSGAASTDATLVQTTGPAAVTLSQTANTPKRFARVALVPALLLLAVATGYALLHWTKSEVVSTTAASAQHSAPPGSPSSIIGQPTDAPAALTGGSTAASTVLPSSTGPHSPIASAQPSRAEQTTGTGSTTPVASARGTTNPPSRAHPSRRAAQSVENAAGF